MNRMKQRSGIYALSTAKQNKERYSIRSKTDGERTIINPRFPEIGNLIEESYSEAAEREAEYLLQNESG
ncbi:MAG: hypothetical protein Q7J09_09800 [Methanocalculus sp.]|uniref:hypothetical protein n=1 Tax=Methanocalculus sp. TaxID=2004547 RepID=UPI002725EF98|nr:hypothetical protein [Methanocalculus sp.]MDO9540278.1 hypothetical protein [Methanocalculus sp.]